ncbi:hypothetical protein [Helicovermis profundi]|uniref:Uncharacterized protein n=1 Tax=Helicovermis profundi TaxID=3065157 RepID=A0AAU9E3U8_9FIRM|nr:hypothetical protein HLPR_16420 [Clostridia bacterium S502]
MQPIKENQELNLTNVISIRKKLYQEDLNDEIKKIGEIVKEEKLNLKSGLITATYSMQLKEGKQFLDVEILLSVDREVKLPNEYTLKKEFVLKNAIYKKHIGDPNGLGKSAEEMINYINQNNYQSITSLYCVQPMQVTDVNNPEIECYIGVNPNKL